MSGLVFISEWYFLFYDWSIFHFLNSLGRPGIRVTEFVIISIPSIALLFGHITAIAILGVGRSALKELRPHRVYSLAGSAGEISHVRGEVEGKTAEKVTIIQWIGFAVIGIIFVAALKILASSVHPRSVTDTNTMPSSGVGASSDPASQSVDILSDHGPKRVGCDGKWLDQPDSSYEDFLRKCMGAPP